MLRRIPAVKWAFTRLRPVPHGGSIDVNPLTADISSVIAEGIAADNIAKAAPARITDISAVSARDDVEIACATRSAEDDVAISVMAESPPAAPADAGGSDDSSRETPSEIEPVIVERASVSTIQIATAEESVASDDPAVEISTNVEAVDADPAAVGVVSEPADAELVIGSDPFPARPTDAGFVVAEEASPSSVGVESAPDATRALAVNDDRSPAVMVDVEATVEEPCVTLVGSEGLAEPFPEARFHSDPFPGAMAATEPGAADVAAPVTAVAAAQSTPDTAGVATDIEPALVSPSAESLNTPKGRARAAEPADRTALIRQRWAETGIRMWNPRLHGTGEATLNIQGSVGLLPPAPGETMPRYDKLEFKMLGGQIVCEGVILEAPGQASRHSFTRLAEPSKIERAREPAQERQAALA
ncbi:hypothetical protein JQ544_06270 [Bradyrhizobium diazoefficiens]|nr:hypothetical protein [Bradyrhizobium diazoefficiens]MBR0811119.1 hypothetical protein [Bradyrhizobium diazoefficiens]